MKITKRIAEEQYCYTEVEFSSLEEYERGYPIFSETMKRIKKQIGLQSANPEEYLNATVPGFADQPRVKQTKKK